MIKGRSISGIQQTGGSMVVEAAMVLPFFLLFVLFLIYIVQMTLFSTALQSTVSDTVKEVAVHMYPAAMALERNEESGSGGTVDGNGNTDSAAASAGSLETDRTGSPAVWTIPRLSVTDWAEQYASGLPSPLDEWITNAAEQGEGPLQQLQAEASEAVLDTAVKPLLKPYLSSGILEYNRIHVSNVTVPNLKDGSQPYFGIEISYDLPVKVPFLNRSIVLEAAAEERLWIGETEEGEDGGQGSGEEYASSIVILEKPAPARPGNKGIIRIKVEPADTPVSLTIFYNSGRSTAKYLGWKQADENGVIVWEWNVGGNTTPGSWPTFVLETEDGQKVEGTFYVADRRSG